MSDPTYDQEEIDARPNWQLAFSLSEIMNDNAPIESNYIEGIDGTTPTEIVEAKRFMVRRADKVASFKPELEIKA